MSKVWSTRIAPDLYIKAEKAVKYDHLMGRIILPTRAEWLKWLIQRRLEEIKKGDK